MMHRCPRLVTVLSVLAANAIMTEVAYVLRFGTTYAGVIAHVVYSDNLDFTGHIVLGVPDADCDYTELPEPPGDTSE